MNRRAPGFLRRLAIDRRGMSAVEFALLAPVMILFYFGLAEFCQGYMAQKRMGHSASMLADMVAQTDVVTQSQLQDMFAIGAVMMKPYSADTLELRVSSVTRNTNGVAKVDWSLGTTHMAALQKNATVSIPTGLIANGESVIMSEATYEYESPVKYLMNDAVTFDNVFYLRPRRVDVVGCSNC